MNTKISKQLRSFRNSSALTGPMAALGAMSVLFGSGAAHAGGLNPDTLPTGANVVGGKATIAQSGNTLDVNQSTNRTVIDWRSFDIGSNATTNFHQPGSSSIAVNRVNSSANPTDIEGHLNANGQVWILNPNGVFFGKTARVDAAGIVASTANIDASRFMAGDTRLQMTGADHGSVVNQGSITVGQSGLAAFVAPSVRNSGTITATVGKVTLAAGTTYTLDLAGDQLVEIGLGAGKALVDQSGKIVNAGGRVTLTAKAASQVVDSVVNVSGVVDASSVHMDGGTVVLGGDDVTTTSTAQIKADGGTAGAGNGGTITAVAGKTGDYAGSFSAKGGTTAGDGGKVETSGHDVTVAAGTTVNTSAANGKAGTWLLDPADLIVDSSLASTIETNLSNGNVIESGTNSATVNAAIDTSAQSNSNTLTLDAPTISLNAPITLASTQTLAGTGTTVNVASTGLIQNGVDVALDGGATVNVAAGTYSDPAVSITKSGISLVGATGAKITVSTATTNGIDIYGANDSVSGFEITGPADGTSYLTFAWGNDVTRGIAVHNGATNFAITGNNIHGLRNDILIDGRNTGSVTGNTIDNSKSGISVQYTDAGAGNTEGYTVDISGNTEGTFGNEWGMNVHLNGHYDDATTSTGYHGNGAKIAADAPGSVQTALLAASSANGGWTVQDQGYSNSNRTAVTVDTAGSDSNQGSPLSSLATISAGVTAVVSGGTVNVNAGSYTLSGELDIAKSLTLTGAGEGSTNITSNSTGYGIYVTGNDVSLSGFTYNGPTAVGATYGIKVEPGTNVASDRVTGFSISNVDINGGYRSGLDLNGVDGATIDGVSVENIVHGNGIGLTDSANVTITNSTTTNNAWGGLALYQTNHYYDQQVSHISADATNHFNEANPVYFEDQSSGSSDPQSVVGGSGLDYDFSTINIAGYGYAAHNTDPLDAYTWLQTTEQKAVDFLDANSLISTGYVSDWSSTGATGQFYVGTSTGGHAMSIATAVGISGAGDTINVGAGTYTDALNINHSVDIEGAGVGQTIIQPTSLLSTGVTHKYTSNVKATVFVHDTTGVTLNNLTIDGNNLGNDAIVFWNNASGTISNALIENAMTYSGAQTGQGIAVDATTGNNVNLSVSGTTITNFNKNAIDALNGDGSVGSGGGNITLNVSGSTFIGQGTGGPGHQTQNGIVLWERGGGTVNATIDGSHFSNLQNEFASTPDDWAVGVLQYGSPNGTVSVTNSDFTNTQSYISTAGGVAHELDATVGNTFDGVAAGSATLDQLFAIQNKIIDGLIDTTNSLVRLVPNNIYLTSANGDIQNAVDVALAGNTINVQGGTYGSFRVSSGSPADLTIQTNAGAVIDASAVPTTPITRIVDLQGDGTTFSGFTITGNGNDVGIAIGGQGVTASGNTINNTLTGIQTNTLHATGNVTISGNTIDSQYGISLQNAGDTVTGNTVTASVEGVGLRLAANTTFSGNTFNIGAAGHALNFVDAVSQSGLTASSDTVNIQGGDVQGAVDLAGTNGALNLAAGTYAVPGELKISNDGLTLTGAGDGSTILDSSSTGYGIAVSANNVTLSSFTYNANPSGSYSFKISPLSGPASSRVLNFAIDHVTINGSHKTGLDLNGVNGATIDHVNVNNTTNGNGITLTDSANVTITNSTTTGNAWGGLALYQSNVYYDQQVNNIVVDGTNTFNEANGIYAQDQSAATDFGTIDLSGQGINYVAKLVAPAASGDGTYTFFQKTEQGAFDLGDAFNTRYSVTGATVQGYAGDTVNGNNTFFVGFATNSDPLSIQAAVDTATAAGTINVDSGTYASFGTSFGGPADLTIQTSEGAVIDASAVPTSSITRAVDLRADGTTFSGFTITGNGNDVGISISGQGVMASGNTISNTLTGIQTTTQYVTGNVTISGNTIDSQYGISLQNAGDTVSDNNVTASVEGVGLIHSASSSFSGNTFNIGASGNALDYYGSASAADLTDTGNTVNIAGGGVQGAVDLAGTNGALNLAAGTYTMSSELDIPNSGLTLTGAGQATTILNSTAGLGINVMADDTTLSGFTLNMPSNVRAGIGANLTGASILQNFDLHDVTVNASGFTSAVTVVLSNNTRIDSVATPGYSVVGFEIDNSTNVTMANNVAGNTLMGLLLIQDPFAPQTDNVNVDGSNSFGSSIFPVALFDYSAGSPGFGALNIAGYSFATHNGTGGIGDAAFLAPTEQAAIDQADALDFYSGLFGISNAVSTSYVTGWTASGNDANFYVGTTTGGNAMSISTAVTNSASGDAVHVDSGTYTLAGELDVNKSLSVTGAGDGSTIINSTSTGYGISVTGNNVTLSSFTFNPNSGGTYGIKVSPESAPASSRLLNFAIDHVTINGSHKTGLDLNGVNGATIDHVDVNNTTNGNGITLTDSANVTITNSTTTGNAWGGLALYQSNVYYDQQVNNIVVDGTNTFNEANGIYAQDQSAATDFGTIDLSGQGINYVAKLVAPAASGDGTYTFFQKTEQGAFDLGDAFNTRYSVTGATVQGYAGDSVNGNNTFFVGFATNTDPLSIQAAVDSANAGGTINVDSGTYAEDVTDSKQLTFDFGAVTLNSIALASGADGSSLSGNLIASGDITSAVSTGLDGAFTAAAIGLNGAATLTGDTTLNTSGGNGNVTLASLVGGGHGLTVSTGTGTTSLGNVANGGALSVSGASTLTGTSYVASSESFGGAATLTGDTILNTSGSNGNVTLASVTGAGHGLTVSTGTGKTSLGNVTNGGALSVSGTSTLTGTSYVASSESFGGAATLTGNTTLNTSAANGNVTLASLVGGGHGLTVSTGTGTTSLGNVTNGGALSVSGASTLTGTSYVASSESFGGAATLTGNTTLNTSGSNGNVTLASVTGAGHGLTVSTGTGTTSLGNVTNGGALSVSGASTLTGTSYVASSESFGGAATLTGNTTLNTSAANGNVTLASVTGAGHGLTVATGTGKTSLGNVTNGGALSVSGPAILTGNAYVANSLSFANDVTLTGAQTVLNTAADGGDITVAGAIFGTADGAQSITLNAGPGTGSAAANGDISLENVGTSSLRLDNMTVQGGNFSAATVYMAGNYSSILTGNQVFITHTLNAGGNVTSNVSGNASGPINSSGTVSLNIGGNLNGNVTAPTIGVTSGSVTNSALTGTNVTVTSGTVASTIINASGQGTVNANTIDGQFNGGTFTLTATNHVNATVNANTVSLVSPTGTVKGTWTTLDTGTNGSLAVNGETRVGNGKAGPNQIVVEGFALPAGSAVTASGQLVLPQGVVIGLLTPAGASGKPRIVLVHSVRMLGQLLSDGYTAIVIDLNNHKDRSIREVKLASN